VARCEHRVVALEAKCGKPTFGADLRQFSRKIRQKRT